ncbi:hypothetical protein [Pseudoteredinibacter isoporae]|uniref:hypothetical protein n=1 Tax=Pseudoteredinibacter isoporae TaxID=570281 RepID=UPI003342D611
MDTPHATSHNNMGHASLHAHDEMNHDTVMDAGTADMADCCGAECSCPSSSCSSISSLTSKPNTVPLEGNSNVRFRYSLKYPKTFSASLFRPPIVL